MKFLFTLLLGNIFFLAANAQVEGGQRLQQLEDNPSVNFSDTLPKIFGKLMDKSTGKPIEAASVIMYAIKGNRKGSVLSGMLSKPNGDFSFRISSGNPEVRIIVSALGYKKWEQVVVVDEKDLKHGSFHKDLGNIPLESIVKQLQAVTVTATRPALQMGIDRKVFNVEKSLTSSGATAFDIMKNIPSISVNADGTVELRNSTPQIFVDGRPTILTLDQIPADNIERIELITNPSAKFDAETSGGIINVVLKKNKRIGLNGVASVGGGVPSLFSSDLNVNLRQGKFNFFVSGSFNRSGGTPKSETLRQNKDNGVVTDFFNQYSNNIRSRKFYSLRGGADYFIDNRNTLSLIQNFVAGRFGNDQVQQQEYLDNNKEMEYYGQRNSDGRFSFNRRSTRLSYKYEFPKQGKEFTADVNYNYGDRSDYSNILNELYNTDGTVYEPASTVTDNGNSNEHQLTIQADFVDPISETKKIETGIRSFRDKFQSVYDAYSYDSGLATKLPLSNNYEYTENIEAAYLTFSEKQKNFSYQLGLRAEYSKFDGLLIDSSYKFGYEYPSGFNNIWNALFPSVFVTRKIGDDNELQFNYTRRTRRPRFWEMNPFIDISDPANLRQGNPQLTPEFINSFELNFSRNYSNGNFLGVLYFVNNPHDITQFSDTITTEQYQQLGNAGISPNAILNTFINANTTNRYGAEFTLQHTLTKNLNITPSINLQYRTTKADVNTLSLSNGGFNWGGKLLINYKTEITNNPMWDNVGVQLSGQYQSPRVIPQGKQLARYNLDFAIRKDFLKNKKANITLAVNDILNSQRWGTIYDTDKFYQYSYSRWNVRTFRLTFSYKFGDPNFSLAKKQNNNNKQNAADVSNEN